MGMDNGPRGHGLERREDGGRVDLGPTMEVIHRPRRIVVGDKLRHHRGRGAVVEPRAHPRGAGRVQPLAAGGVDLDAKSAQLGVLARVACDIAHPEPACPKQPRRQKRQTRGATLGLAGIVDDHHMFEHRPTVAKDVSTLEDQIYVETIWP